MKPSFIASISFLAVFLFVFLLNSCQEPVYPDSISARFNPEFGRLRLKSPSLRKPLTPGNQEFLGFGAPGHQVEVLINGESMGRQLVGKEGAWLLPVHVPAATQFVIVIKEFDSSGQQVDQVIHKVPR